MYSFCHRRWSIILVFGCVMLFVQYYIEWRRRIRLQIKYNYFDGDQYSIDNVTTLNFVVYIIRQFFGLYKVIIFVTKYIGVNTIGYDVLEKLMLTRSCSPRNSNSSKDSLYNRYIIEITHFCIRIQRFKIKPSSDIVLYTIYAYCNHINKLI